MAEEQPGKKTFQSNNLLMKKIKILILGAGNIASEHLKVLKKEKTFEVIGLISRTEKKVKNLCTKFNIPVVTNNISNFIKNSRPDGIMILVSADQIYKTAKKVMKFKIPLFLEKPPGLSIKEVTTLAKLSEKFKTPNIVGFNRRYYSSFEKGLNLIKKNGKLLNIMIEGHERIWTFNKKIKKNIKKKWLYANCIHTIDLLRFFGGDIKTVYSLRKRLIEKNFDNFSALVKFKNGLIGNYISNWYSPGGWSVKLFGNKITVIFEPLERGYWIDKRFKRKNISLSKKDQLFKPGFYKQIKFFKQLIITKKINGLLKI